MPEDCQDPNTAELKLKDLETVGIFGYFMVRTALNGVHGMTVIGKPHAQFIMQLHRLPLSHQMAYTMCPKLNDSPIAHH